MSAQARRITAPGARPELNWMTHSLAPVHDRLAKNIEWPAGLPSPSPILEPDSISSELIIFGLGPVSL